MGAFLLLPILVFSVFVTGVIGFTDYVHVAMLVHAAAQNAAQAASEVASTTGSGGVMETGPVNQPIGGVQHVALSYSGINATVGEMLDGKPYITGYSCGTTGAQVYCHVYFNVSIPIYSQIFHGPLHATTSASSSSAAS